MKKLAPALCLLLALALCLTPLSFAAEPDFDTLADWNIRIHVPEGKTALLAGDSYYIYAMGEGAIPYVMLTVYSYSSLERFVEDFTAYMQGVYADLEVVSAPAALRIGDKNCVETVYSYSVSGYAARDRRVAFLADGLVYLFCSKEVEELGLTVGSMLEDVIADCELLSSEPVPADAEETAYAGAYLYCLDDGMPKYWLDLSYAMADDPVLHCYFRSGDPSFYESCCILDLDTADIADGRYDFHDVTDMRGFDRSELFETLALVTDGDAFVLEVTRRPETLAGGSEDNLLDGEYRMEPMRVGVSYEYRENNMRKYWLEEDGDAIVLHAMFRSGDPSFYEERFLLDLASAESDGQYGLSIQTVTHESGEDVSAWFRSLTLGSVQGAILMNVKRNEATLAGGMDDNILTGVYLFEPQSYLLPAEAGPCSPEQLARAAQLYYFRQTGFYPPVADAELTGDGSVIVHLYELVELDGVAHTATSAWYTVDEQGEGTDNIFGKRVSLCR